MRSHLRGSVVSGFAIVLGKGWGIIYSVYMNMLFKGIGPLDKWNGVIMSIILLGAVAMHAINIVWFISAKCVSVAFITTTCQTSTTYYTLALINTGVFWLLFVVIVVITIILMVKSMCVSDAKPAGSLNES